MHGHEAKIDQWVNHTPDYSEKIKAWLDEQIEIAMGKYFDEQHDAERIAEAEEENRERAELARLKEKYEQP
jgi:hypothetical protein